MAEGAGRVIDAHAHVWQLATGEYGWLDEPRWSGIRRDFRLDDLHAEMTASGVDEVVLVHAAATIAETERLVAAAEQHPWIAGVVSGGNLGDLDHLGRVLSVGARAPSLVGFRHMLGWGQAYTDTLEDGTAFEGAKMLAGAGLTIEFHVTSPAEMSWVPRLAAVAGDVPVVVDHLGKPPLLEADMPARGAWSCLVAELAEVPTVYMKFSGWSTPPRARVVASQVEPYLDHVLESFGPERVMFGSNWPTTLVSADYDTVTRESAAALGRLSATVRAGVLANAARAAFRLSHSEADTEVTNAP
jgi:L-fuconolactonase